MSDDARLDRLQHQAIFLFSRGLTSGAMDHWNERLVRLGHLMSDPPSKFGQRTLYRILGKLERATEKQLRQTGLTDGWRATWLSDAADDPKKP